MAHEKNSINKTERVPKPGLKTPLPKLLLSLAFSLFLSSITFPFSIQKRRKEVMVGPSLHTFKPSTTIKFLCSYGGKIVPRYRDGKLRYHGGETRVLAVDRSISFAELLLKLGELCGTSVSLRCQLPTEDLDALVSITSDEDLANLIEEYDRASSSSLKIRAFLSLPKSKSSPSPSPPSSSPSPTLSSSTDSSSSKSCYTASTSSTTRFPMPATDRCHHHHHQQVPAPVALLPLRLEKSAGKMIPHHGIGYYAPYHGNPGHVYLIHNDNYWQ